MKYELTPLRGPRSGGYAAKAKAREQDQQERETAKWLREQQDDVMWEVLCEEWKRNASPEKQRRLNAALGLDDDDCIIGEIQSSEPEMRLRRRRKEEETK